MLARLKGAGDRDGPMVQISNTNAAPYAVGAFMGAKRPQLPDWIGNQSTRGDNPKWGTFGLPAPVADAIDGRDDEIRREVLQAIDRAASTVGLDME